MGASQSQDGMCNFTHCPASDQKQSVALQRFLQPGWQGMGRKQYHNFLSAFRKAPQNTWRSVYQDLKEEAECMGMTDQDKARIEAELKALKAELCVSRGIMHNAGHQGLVEPGEEDCGPILKSFPAPEMLPVADLTMMQNPNLAKETIAKAAISQRNLILSHYNLLIENYNLMAKESEKFVCMLAVNLPLLMNQKLCATLSFLMNTSGTEWHIGDALRREVKLQMQSQWELGQLDELLSSLVYSEPRSKYRMHKAMDNLIKIRETVPIGDCPPESLRNLKNLLSDFQKNLGQLSGILDTCLKPSLTVWTNARQPIKASIAFFMLLVQDAAKNNGDVDESIKMAARDCGFEYAEDDDWLEKLAAEKSISATIFDIEQAFQHLQGLTKQIADSNSAFTQQLAREEIVKPWTLMTNASGKVLPTCVGLIN